jgi:hypothetical protein
LRLPGGEPAAQRAIDGYDIVRWSSDGTTCRTVSDLNVAELDLETFARSFYASPEG